MSFANSYVYLFQSKIIQELSSNGVQIYAFPTDDESVSEVNTSMNTHVPFAVVGSTEFIRIGNKTVRARQYPWGTVQGKQMSCEVVYGAPTLMCSYFFFFCYSGE